MFAESPGLNAVEHPVFDVWLTDCQKPVKALAAAKPADADASASRTGKAGAAVQAAPADEPVEPRRRVRR